MVARQHINEKSFRPSSSMLQGRVTWHRYDNERQFYNDVIVRETIMSYVAIAAIVRRVSIHKLVSKGVIPLGTSP